MLRAITTEMMYVLILLAFWLCAYFGAWPICTSHHQSSASWRCIVFVSVLMLSIDAKFWGVVVMGAAVIILFFLPWLDNSAVKSIRYRPDWHKYMYAVFVVNFLMLAYLGVQPPSAIGERVSQVGTLFYFGFFLLMPIGGASMGEFKPVPDRVTFTPH
jgi:ubiquinol-cytochrome c reductase cytochrome b subunit